jgi:hypothetical protein
MIKPRFARSIPKEEFCVETVQRRGERGIFRVVDFKTPSETVVTTPPYQMPHHPVKHALCAVCRLAIFITDRDVARRHFPSDWAGEIEVVGNLRACLMPVMPQSVNGGEDKPHGLAASS